MKLRRKARGQKIITKAQKTSELETVVDELIQQCARI